MPVKPHPTDPDKLVYASRQYDIPQLQGVTTTQRPWVGLTDDAEIFAISNTMPYADRFEFARAIEAKLKEKNT
jgi:hypothetical protein